MALRAPMRSTDRVLVLAKIDPKAKDIGILDPNLFDGGNNLHVVMDPSTLLWSFKYEHGIIPAVLKNRYTSFKLAKDQAELYFNSKKIKIVEVRD